MKAEEFPALMEAPVYWEQPRSKETHPDLYWECNWKILLLSPQSLQLHLKKSFLMGQVVFSREDLLPSGRDLSCLPALTGPAQINLRSWGHFPPCLSIPDPEPSQLISLYLFDGWVLFVTNFYFSFLFSRF